MKVFGALVGSVVAFTFLTGGNFSIGVNPASGGPYLGVGFTGPQAGRKG